jgi:hypothetical protein
MLPKRVRASTKRRHTVGLRRRRGVVSTVASDCNDKAPVRTFCGNAKFDGARRFLC